MKRIFLTGPIGCGKSTLIRAVLGDSLRVAGGFVTERVFEGGELTGFDLVSLGVSASQWLVHPDFADLGLREKAGQLRLRFLTFQAGKVIRNDEAFSVFASALLREACTKPFAVIDEIGGFELLLPEFMEAFEQFYASQLPCAGVLKSPPASEKLSRTAGLSPEYLKAASLLRLRFASDPETVLAELGGHDDTYALNALRQWKEHYLSY